MQVYDTMLPALGQGALALSPDGRHLATGGCGRLVVVDTLTGTPTAFSVAAAPWSPTGLGFTAGGRIIASPGRRLGLYDPATGERRGLGRAAADRIATTPDGTMILATAQDDRGFSRIDRWDGSTLKPLPEFGRHRGRRLTAVAVSADGTRGAAAGGKWVRTWNLSGDKPPARATFQLKTVGWAKAVALSRDGLLLATPIRNRVAVWDAKTSAERFAHTQHKVAVNAVALSPTRPLLVSGGNDGLVFVYDVETGTELKRMEWKVGAIVALAFAPDGLRCAAASATGKVVVWDLDG